MAILSDDLVILKSAVMADVPEGGGGATGTPVVDGVSNNIFPDVSDDNRAGGAFHLRKVFGKVRTDNQDLLLGAGFAVLKPPVDPAVDVTIFETDGWFDERTAAVALVESTMVKGPRLLCRVQDTHYAGVSVLQLYNVAPGTSFPAAGDSIVLRNPSGTEVKARALKVDISTALVTDVSGTFQVNLATCQLNKPLPFDILGAPVQRAAPSASSAATVFSTAPATGARFHGVKPLATAVTLGATPIREVTVSGGIFSQLVPASTVPTPVVDVYPLVQRPTLSRTAQSPLTVSTAAVALAPGTVLRLPTAAQPGTLTMSHGATAFTTNNAGELLQGSTVVGSVDWAARTISMLGTSPNYGSATNAITYTPATVTGATAHSRQHLVTDANQSTALVAALEPPPAPGTLTVSYMAQGRWYDLLEDGTGKLAGSDSSYGAGTLSFVTGSLAASMGALPDIDSSVILTWGEADSAVQATGMPTRAWAYLPIDDQPTPGTLSIAWSRGATNYTATVAANGVVTGPAQVGQVRRQDDGTYLLPFSPNTLPDGSVTLTYQALADVDAFTNGGGGAYTLTNTPVKAGTVRFNVIALINGVSKVIRCYSQGTEVYAEGLGVIGTINNTTGVMALSVGSQSRTVYSRERHEVAAGTYMSGTYVYYRTVSEVVSYTLQLDTITSIGYQPDAATAASTPVIAPSWVIDAEPAIGLATVTTDSAFTWGGTLHFSRDGSVFRGWSQASGATTMVGAIDSAGRITLGATAPGGDNTVTWHNLAHDKRGGLDVLQGVFRIPQAPVQANPFQLQAGAAIGNADSGGAITGDFVGDVDGQRGIVVWAVADLGPGEGEGTPVRADEVTYNAIYLQYVPLDAELLGVDTSGLPADGKVPIYRSGGHVLVHHTDTLELPNPVVRDNAYSLGRARVASVVVRDAVGTRLPGTLYEVNRNTGHVTVPTASDLSTYAQPLTVEHRVQDELQVISADISGHLLLAGALSHNYPVPGSYVSSKLRQGDKFARVFGYADRTTWQGSWAATIAGSDIGAVSFNSIDHPIQTSNRGAITERWACIFNNSTEVRVVGEHVGQVLSSAPIGAPIAPINPQESPAPYFTIPSAGWGGGWSTGQVLLFETQAAGAPTFIARSVLPGGTEVLDDSAIFALIANVDQP